MPDPQTHNTLDPKNFAEMFSGELGEILQRREQKGIAQKADAANIEKNHEYLGEVYKEAYKAGLFGVAFSGGGIRSATFNLGVLQALAKLKLLRRIDYLSTVSGGGYIGSWLQGWCTTESDTSKVSDILARSHFENPPYQEAHQIRFLRDYSNYLTPRKGIFGADSWTVASMYIRNLVLNLLILVSALLAVLLLPYVLTWLQDRLPFDAAGYWLSIGIVSLTISVTNIIKNLGSLTEISGVRSRRRLKFTKVHEVITSIIAPIFLSAVFVNRFLMSTARGWSPADYTFFNMWTVPIRIIGILVCAIIYFCLWVVAIALGSAFRQEEDVRQSSLSEVRQTFGKENLGTVLGYSILAGAVGGGLLWLISEWHYKILLTGSSINPVTGVPLVLLAYSAVAILHIGLAGKGFSEEAREWWARLGAFVGIFAVSITLFFVVTLGDAKILNWIFEACGFFISNASRKASGTAKFVGIVVWIVTTISGVIVGKNSNTKAKDDSVWAKLVARIAPFVFIFGLLLLLSWLAQLIFSIPHVSDGWLPLVIVALAVLATFLSFRIGVNEFSMHSMYRNRLVRCYLGARNRNRKPHLFTGFDPNDDSITLQSLADSQAPYPIINATLNLVHGDRLAWQDRKAASFVFTPLYSGYEYQSIDDDNNRISSEPGGYRPTEWYGEELTLGNAFAVSGAAASPNMGYNSSPALAFLMTVFNVRLGCWIGNPRRNLSERRRLGPLVGLFYLTYELLGMTNDKRDYLYISDGGHFENLGLYELVRRRCRYILVSDAGSDASHTFGDIGNAIEKCRTDFGIDIKIDVNPIRFQPDGEKSQWHCAVGKIQYSKVDESAPDGIIVYIKPSLTGDEPTDVQRYASKYKSFPHQSTADQWFDESQFESYRMLGEHIVSSVFEAIEDDYISVNNSTLFDRLRKRWYSPTIVPTQLFTKHTATFTGILERLKNDENLRFLDRQIYPEWNLLSPEDERWKRVRDKSMWLPDDPEEFRAGFYICNQMIQLMEDAYLDLRLEEDFDHPDNRGWINLFKHWCWSGMFRITYAMSAGMFGARFQTFCKDYLALDTGKVIIRDPEMVFDVVQGKNGVLNFLEKEVAKKLLASEQLIRGDMVIPFSLEVQNPANPDQSLRMPFGFCLARFDPEDSTKDGTLLYFRIQDHVRKMGLAYTTLLELTNRENPICINKIDLLDTGQDNPDGKLPPSEKRRFESLFRSALEK
jgi:hypothetical protein